MRSEQEITERINKIEQALKNQNVANTHKWHYKEIVQYLKWAKGEDITDIF